MPHSASGSTSSRSLKDETVPGTTRELLPDYSDTNPDMNADDHLGDYSTRMEELFDDGEDGGIAYDENSGEDDEEGFVYNGVDTLDNPTGYSDQLRDVLGTDFIDDDMDILKVDKSLVFGEYDKSVVNTDTEHVYQNISPTQTPSNSALGVDTPPDLPPGLHGVPRPFLLPGVSRLRSSAPNITHFTSSGSGLSTATSNSHVLDGFSPTPSHLSATSRVSSPSNTNRSSEQKETNTSHSERDVFQWTELSGISEQIYNSLTQKLTSVLGAPLLGAPTVLAANGLICIGTDQGKICVYDFKQALKCICGETSVKTVGAVTALALSHDHTYIASGHASGHLQLFDLKNPKTPARLVPPTTLKAVASGRKEGHIEGSRIVSVAFIAGRHTAIVSSDDHGLAFSHSLGKMLFVEAPDILRILGQYQPGTQVQVASPDAIVSSKLAPDTSLLQRKKSRYTILETMPLPLGTSPHATDAYNVIAMLTPTKLVVVGLKPTPRTWFKCPREVEESGISRSKPVARGTLAWYPSVLPSSAKLNPEKHATMIDIGSTPTTPILVYTWGSTLRLIRVDETRSREMVRNTRTGKVVEVDVGRIFYENVGHWCAASDIIAAQWLNMAQIIVLTAEILQVYDIQAHKVIESIGFDGLSLVSPSHSFTPSSSMSYSEPVADVAHSLRVYKGKIFMLDKHALRVGTLLTWADRVLSFVHEGKFLHAIDLATSYYVGVASGNRNGLPDDPILRKEAIGGKLKDLLTASTRYTFSEDRMTDGTHVTADGRGVDRTSLFEGLVTVSCRASIALGDFDFLFEDLFQQYDDSCIPKIYLHQLEPFMLNNDLRNVPPRITQRLVALHEEDGRSDLIERLIWHIDPASLDINQAIHLCQIHQLYDALIYIYTRALRDTVAPIVELLSLIRKVQQYRRSRTESHYSDLATEAMIEPIILNAYKIYPYLSNILSGLSYPSEEPLVEDEALSAKKAVYTFVFFGRSSVWPPGEGGKLVLTADEEGGVEPTYPYVRQLLRFDSESFLHSLDIAFEDSFLNDEHQGVSRLVVVRILLELLSAKDLPSKDITFVNIFIARNVPKYPQFLPIPPSALHGIIVGLAEDPDPDTREDRQLAAEYLLSAYNPHESERIIGLFQSAGFYRILRSWYRHEQQWGPLLSAYLDDHSLRPFEVFHNIDEILNGNSRINEGSLSPEVHSTLSSTIPQLLDMSLTSTAVLLDEYTSDLHEIAVENIADDFQRLCYLRRLLGPASPNDEEEELIHSSCQGPSMKVSSHLRQIYISLQCRYHPKNVINALRHLPSKTIDWNSTLAVCEANEVYEAVVWAINWCGNPQEALQKADTYQKRLATRLIGAIFKTASSKNGNIQHDLELLESLGGIGVYICLTHSQSSVGVEVPLEDIWFQLLSSQINTVQVLSTSQQELGTESSNITAEILTTLRILVQKTFASLVSITSNQAVSFPRLFKRLVDSAPPTVHTQYTEFRTILTGMLESYHSEGDMLTITKHLVDRDLFETMLEMVRERDRGWSPSHHDLMSTPCPRCRKSLLPSTASSFITDPNANTAPVLKIMISRTGIVYHNRCSPLKH